MRKLKENFGSSLKLDVVELSNDFPEISIDKLATELADNLGVDISKEEDDGTVYMVINDTDTDTVIDEISDILYAKTDMEDLDEIKSIVSDFIIEDDLNEAYDYQTIDDIPPSPYYNEYPDIDYPDEAFDDYDEEDYPPYDEYDEFEDDEYDDDDALNDCVDNDKFMDEDDEFECYESKKYLGNGIKYLGNGIYEKKSTCCPKRRGKRMVNLSESLSRRNNVLTESIINRAIRKARKEKNSRNSLRVLKETLGTDKFNMVVNAMKEGRKYLYENKKINGKRLSEYSAKKLFSILKEIKEQYNLLNKRLHSLNESASLKEEIELNEKIENKLKLMNILDEELTYRLTIKRLLEEEENNPLEPLDVNPNEMDDSENSNETDDSENPEEDEEVELSRVVITVANQDAADELKTSMVDAGIPEDAIEFETEESEEGEEGEETEETEETEGEEGEETEGESNESIFYKKFKKLLEDDAEGEESDGDEESETDEESDGEETEGEEESEDSEDEESVKVVLTNTDYINDLANVLETEYGITKDEFEEMIGGEIIQDDDDSDDESDDESDDDKSDDDSDEKEDKKSSKGDDAVDAMSPEELDKLFGNN